MKVSHLFPRLEGILREACQANIQAGSYDAPGCEPSIQAVVNAVRQSDTKDAKIDALSAIAEQVVRENEKYPEGTHGNRLWQKAKEALAK